MIIEYSNAKEAHSHTRLSVVIVVASCAFFFIPTTLIVLGYLASQPTGSLISPLPQGVLSQSTPTPSPLPIIAAPNEATTSALRDISVKTNNNILDKTATVSAGLSEIIVTDPDIKLASQIYLSPRAQDITVYSVKSKEVGQMTIEVDKTSDTVRYVDYQVVNP